MRKFAHTAAVHEAIRGRVAGLGLGVQEGRVATEASARRPVSTKDGGRHCDADAMCLHT
jgi:hypothetical protein